MKLFKALRGGGARDGIRQTQAETMAYLLEQNAQFEAFMRQKVEELEAIVAQQQARQADAGDVDAADVDAGETDVVEAEPEGLTEAGAPEMSAPGQVETQRQAETQPVTAYFSDFALDEGDSSPGAGETVAEAESASPPGEIEAAAAENESVSPPGEEEGRFAERNEPIFDQEAGEVFVSGAEPAGDTSPGPVLSSPEPVSAAEPVASSEPDSPPDWQTLLLNDPPASPAEEETGEPVLEEPASEEPAPEEPALEEPASAELISEEPALGEPALQEEPAETATDAAAVVATPAVAAPTIANAADPPAGQADEPASEETARNADLVEATTVEEEPVDTERVMGAPDGTEMTGDAEPVETTAVAGELIEDVPGAESVTGEPASAEMAVETGDGVLAATTIVETEAVETERIAGESPGTHWATGTDPVETMLVEEKQTDRVTGEPAGAAMTREAEPVEVTPAKEEPAGSIAGEPAGVAMKEAVGIDVPPETATVEARPAEVEQNVAGEPAATEMEEETEASSSLLPAWLRRQQQTRLSQVKAETSLAETTEKTGDPLVRKIAGVGESATEIGFDLTETLGETRSHPPPGAGAAFTAETGPAQKMVTKRETPTETGPVEAENEEPWETALENEGPAGDWE